MDTTRRAWKGALLVLALMAVTGCEPDKLLEVDTPDIITLDAINNAAGAEALRARAIGDLAVLVNGNLGLATTGALMADELASGRPQLDWLDNRNYDETQDINFRQWASQKNSAERAIAALQKYLPAGADRDTKVGHMYMLLGMGMTLLAEHYCNGIPFGRVEDGQMVFEETPLTYTQVFERAIAHYDSALAITPRTATSNRNFARIGKARTLLNLNRPSEAAAVVGAGGDGAGSASVPTTFAWNADFSALSIGNGLYDWIPASGNFTPTHREGNGNYDSESGTGQGLDYIWSRDSRLQIETPAFRLAQDGATRIYRPLQHNTRDAPSKVTAGVEARLIEAEADLRVGRSTWLTTLNTLRSTAISPALPPLTDPGSQNAQVDLLFRERAFWLFLTGHRMGDLRRLIRQYNRSADAVFPSGPYFKGGAYGSDVVMKVHSSERNRPAGAPAYAGCIDLRP
jgi:hypothetical protein